MSWTDDPLEDFNRHEAEQRKWLDSLPKCDDCGEPIQTNKFYLIDGKKICPECLVAECEKETEDFVKGE